MIGTWGNSSPVKTGDWVPVLYQNRPEPTLNANGNPNIGPPCRLSLGANLQILWANVGSLANPQPKVVGASLIYDEKQEVNYQCTSGSCQSSTASQPQNVEIGTAVTYIDVSTKPEGVEGLYPTFAVRLPYDFFYPFLDSAGQSTFRLSSIF